MNFTNTITIFLNFPTGIRTYNLINVRKNNIKK